MTNDLDRGRRRLLLAAIGLAASAVTGPGALAAILDQLEARGAPAEAVRGLISHRAQAERLGRIYLARHPDEASTAVLLRRLLGPRRLRSTADAPSRIADGIGSDYAAARTVIVDGWILSRTEARLFALVALS